MKGYKLLRIQKILDINKGLYIIIVISVAIIFKRGISLPS